MAIVIDFSAARFRHLNWKFRLRSFLDGKETLTLAQATSYKDCDLGKWFESVGKPKYGHFAQMQQFDQTHQTLHNLVAAIIKAQARGESEQAELLYKQLGRISDQIMELLSEVEKIATQKN
ncbi:CZB domain-containing protein [Hugenholtzia roseola]|uniref:CZB domain-containing protein n=1 Tax=Hugenholtzia roseola TaxID=1002 RepID=UPI00047A45AC|nr:CZB domain-containing protein [Hugenholtzia roseola]